MAIIFLSGLESGNPYIHAGTGTSAGGEFTIKTGTVGIVTSPVHAGTYALQCNPTTTGTGYVQWRKAGTDGTESNFNVATIYYGVWFRVGTAPVSGAEPFLVCHDGTNVKLELRLTSDRTIAAYDYQATSLLGTGTTALSLDTWYHIGVKCGTGASAAWEVQIDGASETNLSGTTANLGTTNNNRLFLGKHADRSSQSVNFYFDDLLVDNAEFPSTSAVVGVMLPNGVGNYDTWTPSAGAAWECLDERPTESSTDYVTSPLVAGNKVTVAYQSASDAGITGTSILAVQSYLRCHRGGGTNGSMQLMLRSNGADTVNGTNSASTAAYKNFWLTYATNPNNGNAAWTTSDLDGIEIGQSEVSTANTTLLDNALVFVAHIPAAGQPRFVRNIGNIYTPARGRTGKWF